MNAQSALGVVGVTSTSSRTSVEHLRAALTDLAYNLRWSWDPPTVAVFRALAPKVWDRTHNPVAVLQTIELVDTDALLVAHVENILAAWNDLRYYLSRPTPYSGASGAVPRIAYLSAEFAITECLPVYSGGLGVLAGDHLKAASDLGLPLVGVGLLYRYGYFRQALDEAGYQRERYDRLDPLSLPTRPVLRADGTPILVDVPFPGRSVQAQVWLAQVGRVPLYLLDTELPQNREDDRWITGHLYGGDQDTRIRQEIVLGIGGARLLKALAAEGLVAPEVYHMNEGHSAFVALELARERLAEGLSFEEALLRIAPRVAFTTHTPVEAGHDAFPSDLTEAYFGDYRKLLGLPYDQFMALGRRVRQATWERFSMTVLALRSAHYRNGVSKLHGRVSEQMWSDVGVGLSDEPATVPMTAITNGVHTATWVGPEMASLFDQHLGRGWREAPHEPARWRGLAELPAEPLWAARTVQRERLLRRVDLMARAAGGTGLAETVTPERTLALGFARRFATYKRAGLLLEHPERLEHLLRGDPTRPVVLVFAGKAHPRDEPGKLLVQRIVQASEDPRFRGHLVFLENYDVEIARFLVQGSDVWLNTPRRPQEASGTSGMKATLNGALHLSEVDGWWDEAYLPGIGWALGAGLADDLPSEARDAAEAEQLMDLLEREVAPLFFDRPGGRALPELWVSWVQQSIATLAPTFSAARMVSEYAERVYAPAAERAPAQSDLVAARG